MELMVYLTFGLGALLVLVGLYAFLRRWKDPGATVRVWKLLTIETGFASTLLLVIGGLFVLIPLYLGARIAGLLDDLTHQKGETRSRGHQMSELLDSVRTAVVDAQSQGASAASGGTPSQVGFDGEEFASSLLQSFSRDSFGLLQLPDEAVPRLSSLVETLASSFPDSTKLIGERLTIYRTLYQKIKESGGHDADSYLERWGTFAKEMYARDDLPPESTFAARIHLGVYYQETKEHEKAVVVFDRAAEVTPDDERYKVLFNLCNSYLELGKKEMGSPGAEHTIARNLLLKAIERCAESVRRSPQAARFWLPYFDEGVAHHWLGQSATAAQAFVKGYGVAQDGSEGGTFLKYLSRQADINAICTDASFRATFDGLCG